MTKDHVTRYLASSKHVITGQDLLPATMASRFASWRSFQNFMLEPDRVNEILARFKVRPRAFITDENGIAIKKHKANWTPKGWALTTTEIDAIDQTFISEIASAKARGSKSLLPLIRDRVMFHVAIHFMLRITELVTLRVQCFSRSHDPKLQRFGELGVLTVTGKNDVTGSIPMRAPDMHALVDWYLKNCRQRILMRRSTNFGDDGQCRFNGKVYNVGDLVFPSERGSVICATAFRKRLADIAMKAGVIAKKLTPHTLRHSGCTLIVPLFSPEVAQRYMRHKHLHTTLHYYHPTPLDAANEANTAYVFFDEDESD